MKTSMTKLAKNIRMVVAASAAVSVASISPVFAQQKSNEESVERIAVVGSRAAPRSVTDSAVPIDIIGAEEFRQQGSTDLTSMLQAAVPSFNVNDQPINDASTLVRPANLRGLASDHTLILVNGKRRHRSAVITFLGGGLSDGAQGPDISVIPAIALKQVEVLRDGAAAQYGSDAIAGVINFQLKDDSSGGSIEAITGQFYEGDGETFQVSANVGLPLTDAGFANFSIEYKGSNDTVRSVQRDDAAALIASGNTFVENPAQIWGSPEIKDDIKFFANLGLELSPTSEAYLFGNYAERTVEGGFFFRNPHTRGGVFSNDGGETLLVGDLDGLNTGIQCPTVNITDGNVLDDADFLTVADNSTDIGANCFAFNEMFPGGFTPRFGGDVTDSSLVVGTRGELESEIRYDVSLNFGQNEIDYFIRNTINASLGPDTPTSFRPGRYTQSETTFDFDLSKPFDIGLVEPLFIATGLQYRYEQYESVAGDTASFEIGDLGVQGFSSSSNGFGGLNPRGQGQASRNSIAFYLDAEAYLTDDLLVTAALRYEDFSDFGNTTKGKISVRYQLTDSIAFRGAYATGFKAPTIGQSSVSNITTAIGGNGVLIDTALLPPTNPIAIQAEAEPLTPEESTSFSFGVVAEFDSGLFITLDYYDIELEDRIATTSNIEIDGDDIAALLAQGITEAENFTAISFFNNDFDTTTQGLDLVANYSASLFGGDTGFALAYNWTSTEVDSASDNISEGRIRSLEDNLPATRYSFTTTQNYDKWSALVRINFFNSVFEDHVDANLAFPVSVDSAYTVDLEVGYNVSDQTRIVLGAKNLFDEVPNDNPFAGEFGSQYPVTAPIGINGGFYYLRASYTF